MKNKEKALEDIRSTYLRNEYLPVISNLNESELKSFDGIIDTSPFMIAQLVAFSEVLEERGELETFLKNEGFKHVYAKTIIDDWKAGKYKYEVDVVQKLCIGHGEEYKKNLKEMLENFDILRGKDNNK